MPRERPGPRSPCSVRAGTWTSDTGGRTMRRSVLCFFAGLVLAAAGWMAPAPGETAHTGCGAWRWGVKTLTDSGAGQVALTPRQGQVDALRAPFIQRFGMPSTTHFAPIPGRPLATVTGVLFFDEIHGQKGVAPNGVELHPVIDLK